MLSIICIEIEHAKNLGAICRVMANFGLKDLILINPVCKKDDIEAMIRAKHCAAEILKNAQISDGSILKNFQTLIATTAKLGTSYNIPRSPLTPEQMATLINERNLIDDKEVQAAILIGREGHGLFNEEVKKCDFVVSIPCHEEYNTMNISHAVAILLYEIYKKLGTQRIHKKFHKASVRDKEIILRLVDDILEDMTFKNPSKSETQRIVWKRMIGKATLTKREAFALIGFLKKVKEVVK
jgi:tRNA/rRNA methyltransferase